jgi:cytochrome b pre-mRNA-processing protein 3
MAAGVCQPNPIAGRSPVFAGEPFVLPFLRRRRFERTGFELYGAAVAAARAPAFYADLGVPDTLDGRFDLVGLHVFLLIRRLGALPPPGADLAQAVFDAMFSDMDVNLREIGVGDMSVGKKVKLMWEAFHGRSAAYQAALVSADPTELEAALARNVWRGKAPVGQAAILARITRAQAAALDNQPLAGFEGGQAHFLAPAEAMA